MSYSGPFAEFHILDSLAIDGKAQSSAHFVEAVAPCCAWVDVEHFVDLVVLDTQNVRVSRDKNLWSASLNLR